MPSARGNASHQSGSKSSRSDRGRGRGSWHGKAKRQSSQAAASSAGDFRTPLSNKSLNSRHSIESRQSAFSRQGSVLRTSVARSTPGLPRSASGKRTSFRLPQSTNRGGSSTLSRFSEQTPVLETDDEVREREEADALNEIVLAIDMRERGTLGCAYYVASEEKLFLMADIPQSSVQIVDTLKLHASPTIVLISTRSDDALEEHLQTEARDIGSSDNPGKFYI